METSKFYFNSEQFEMVPLNFMRGKKTNATYSYKKKGYKMVHQWHEKDILKGHNDSTKLHFVMVPSCKQCSEIKPNNFQFSFVVIALIKIQICFLFPIIFPQVQNPLFSGCGLFGCNRN